MNSTQPRKGLRLYWASPVCDCQPMTHRPAPLATALASAMSLPEGEGVPEWVHLLPLGSVTTFNGLGPYKVDDPAAVIAASMQNERGMPIDENHATDLAAPKGGSSPACGWIKELQARADGIWGRVEWNRSGHRLLSQRAYRGISPVLMHDKATMTVRSIARASLTNTPNLRGLVPVLNQESSMDFMAKIAEALGLGADATEEAILASIGKMSEKKDDDAPALMSEITALGIAFGVSGDATTILTGVKAKAGAEPTEVAALQSELKTLGTALATLQGDTKREKAEAFVDGAIKAGRVGVKPSRDRFITMHSENAANAEAIINAMPILGGATLTAAPKTDATTGLQTALSSEEAMIADQLGVAHDAFLKTLNAEQKEAR